MSNERTLIIDTQAADLLVRAYRAGGDYCGPVPGFEPAPPPRAVPAAKELREVEVDEAAPKPRPRRPRDKFPNTGHTTEIGRYGMFHTSAGHVRSVRRCLRALRSVESTFDALYVTGLSGSIPGAVVAYLMRKEIVVLRKQLGDDCGTASHGHVIEGGAFDVPGMRFMILDDFVSQAGTLRTLLAQFPSKCKLAGVMLYGHPRSSNEVAGGIAKVFHTHPATGQPVKWHLVRRGPNSMLFDLVRQD
jgi:hypothetical protein